MIELIFTKYIFNFIVPLFLGVLNFIQYSLSEYFTNVSSFILTLILLILILIIIFYIRANSKLNYSRKILIESEERFRKLSNLTFEGIVIHENGIMIDSNESFLNMFGYTREELTDRNIMKILTHKDDLEFIQENVKKLTTKPYELRGVKKDGEVIAVEIESRNVMLDGREVRVAALRDITERKKQQNTLEREQWFFRTLMNSIPDAIYFKDLESKFIRANRNTIEKFNLQNAAELIGKTDFDFFDEEHARPAYEDEQKIILSREPIVGKIEKETWIDGSVTWASTTKLPLIDMDGNVLGTFGLTRDITELKKAQERAIAEKEKFELLFRLVPSAVFTVDKEQNVTSWNSMAEEITGFNAEDVINKKCQLFAAGVCEEMCGLLDESIKKPIVNAECIIRRKDGRFITVSKNVDTIKDNDGSVIGGVESFIDISERKKHEEEIEKLANELTEINKSKDRFFSIIAHDLRNPFVTLLGFSEMLVEDYDEFTDEEKKNYLKEMYKTSETSYELLENLLQWSRSQTGRIKYDPEKVDFKKLLEANFELVEKTAEVKMIELILKIDNETLLYADDDMLTTVMRNLIANALKFTPQGGRVTVGAIDRADFIEIYVKDTGVGISQSRSQSIFKIDETSSTEGTDGEKGSGLGLILSKEFIEKHGGKIWVESTKGEGATFRFTIPKFK